MNTIINKNDTYKTIIINVKYLEDTLDMAISLKRIRKDSIDEFNRNVDAAYEHLKENGFVYVYGNPNVVSYLVGNYLKTQNNLDFRYWIAINNNKNDGNEHALSRNHVAAIMLIRRDSDIFDFDTEACRTKRFACPTCQRNSKDWGGKKHLLNTKGVAISDVWNDFIKVNSVIGDKDIPNLKLYLSDNDSSVDFKGNCIPQPILERLLTLTKSSNDYKIIEMDNVIDLDREIDDIIDDTIVPNENEINQIICGDSIEVMEGLLKKYPNGLFDLIFADPPYNLQKNYKNYDDQNSDNEYNDWCNKWLDLCFKLLKPNGNMLILNLPKWTIRNISFLLDNGAKLKDCIVWDAMSTPMGKIMPAHYSLIHLVKRDSKDELIKNEMIYPAINYCLRPSCISNRDSNNSRKFWLSNIWSDAHRIKHKKDRDDHPCQLPDKLMNRIIQLYSKPGDLVFDPFCGAGTTAIAAFLNNRNYYTVDISQDYVDIAKRKILNINELGYIKKQSEKKVSRKVPKKKMELYTQNKLLELGYKPTDEDFVTIIENDNDAGFTIEDVLNTYSSVHELIKKCTFVLRKKDL
ncbi:MAG: Modification methylase BamHI [Tenericutes bacterium ADurb.Bin087]|nr:MAG: Modification methylase BamHI [Tenericutes bacterium ADurb.Bin087]